MEYPNLILVIIHLCLTYSSYSSGYKVEISPEQVNKLPEGNSQLITLSLVECENEDIYANFSLHQHVVIGVHNSIDYPQHVSNIKCCFNTTNALLNSNSSNSITDSVISGRTCSKGITIKANVIGFVELTFEDESERQNTSDDFVYAIGVIRPEKEVKDDLFIYGVIVFITTNMLMFGAGLDLQKVKNYLKQPAAPILGLACQFIVMPLLALLLTVILDEHPAIELGLFASGVAPGGGVSNAWAYLLGGDVDLSITMTVISTFTALAFIPLWMYTLGAYLAQDAPIALPFQDMAITLAYTVVPTAIGLLINRFLPKVAKILTIIHKGFLPLFLLYLVAIGIWANIYAFRLVILNYQLLLAGMALPYAGCLVGLLLSLLFTRKLSVAATIGIETGIQNSSTTIVLLRLSLEQPWADISSAIPISVSLFTPWPLIVLVITRAIYLKFCKKKESKEEDDEEKSETQNDVEERHSEVSCHNRAFTNENEEATEGDNDNVNKIQADNPNDCQTETSVSHL